MSRPWPRLRSPCKPPRRVLAARTRGWLARGCTRARHVPAAAPPRAPPHRSPSARGGDGRRGGGRRGSPGPPPPPGQGPRHPSRARPPRPRSAPCRLRRWRPRASGAAGWIEAGGRPGAQTSPRCGPRSGAAPRRAARTPARQRRQARVAPADYRPSRDRAARACRPGGPRARWLPEPPPGRFPGASTARFGDPGRCRGLGCWRAFLGQSLGLPTLG